MSAPDNEKGGGKHEENESRGMDPIAIRGGELNFGLRWDFVGNEPIDLDASCVSFTTTGDPGEVVFYNNLATKGRWMLHTGDNTTGEGDDDDEAIQIFVEKIPEHIVHLVLVVTCHNHGSYLANVAAIECIVSDLVQDRELCTPPVTLSKTHSAIIVCALSREKDAGPHAWTLSSLNCAATGHSVGDTALLSAMQTQLRIHPSQTPALGIDYALHKGDVALVTGELEHLMMGLGWSKEDCDLDAHCILLDKEGLYMDHVTAKTKHSLGIEHKTEASDAALHSGDNAFEGQGDRETIHVKMKNVPSKCAYIYFTVNCVNKDVWSESTLGGTAGAYCRLVHITKKAGTRGKTHNLENRKELCRVNIAKMPRDACALLFAAVHRSETTVGGWDIVMLADHIPHVNMLIPGEFLPLARCSAYFMGDNPVAGAQSGRQGMMGNTWNSIRDMANKKSTLTLEIIEARNLRPQDEVFKCQCMMWLKDHAYERSQRQATMHTDNRTTPSWHQSFTYETSFVDCLRIMVLDVALAGIVDISLFLPPDNKSDATLWERLQSGEYYNAWLPILGHSMPSPPACIHPTHHPFRDPRRASCWSQAFPTADIELLLLSPHVIRVTSSSARRGRAFQLLSCRPTCSFVRVCASFSLELLGLLRG